MNCLLPTPFWKYLTSYLVTQKIRKTTVNPNENLKAWIISLSKGKLWWIHRKTTWTCGVDKTTAEQRRALSSRVLSYPRPSEPACSNQCLLCPQPVSLIKACTASTRARARARKTSATTLVGFTVPSLRQPASFSPKSILTLALADRHQGRGLNHLLSLSLAPPGGHRCPQGQDGQQQLQPEPRTPEHLETVRGGTPSPGGKLPPSSLRNPREDSFPVPPGGRTP